MPTLVINRSLSLDWDSIKGFLALLFRGLMRISNDCGVNQNSAWDKFYEIMFCDPVMIHHFHNSSCCSATAGAPVHHVGSGGQRYAHMRPK